MKAFVLLAALAISSAAYAQQPGRPTTEKDVTPLAAPIFPLPSSRRILVPFGDTARISFKRSFKSIRIGDPDIVRARPETDHVIEFSGLAPGESRFTLEADGAVTETGEIIVVREVREVKMYVPKPGHGQGDDTKRSGIIINVGDNNTQEARKAAEAEYTARLCNEVGCRPVPEAK